MFEWLKKIRRRQPTFKTVAEEWLLKQKPNWVKEVQLYNQLLFDRHPYPLFGSVPIDKVTVSQIRKMILDYEVQAPTQTRRMLGKIRRVFDYAVANGWCEHNPTIGLETILKPLQQKEFAFVPITDIPDLMKSIQERPYHNKAAVTAFWLITYTAVRRGEATFAEMNEFDLENAIWIIPASRMKMRRDHMVPLSPQIVSILEDWIDYRKQAGINSSRIFGDLKDWMVLQILTTAKWRGRMTIHGWRKVFSTHAHESGLWTVDAIEMQLAHIIGGVRGVYNKALLLPERRKMMNWYADEVDRWRGIKTVN